MNNQKICFEKRFYISEKTTLLFVLQRQKLVDNNEVGYYIKHMLYEQGYYYKYFTYMIGFYIEDSDSVNYPEIFKSKFFHIHIINRYINN